jgi:hypothetical protein
MQSHGAGVRMPLGSDRVGEMGPFNVPTVAAGVLLMYMVLVWASIGVKIRYNNKKRTR